jgi:hypothetical protein
MSENLYAPPQAELGAGSSGELGTGDFEIGRCLSEAWARTWANFPLWLGAGVVGVIAMAGSVITIIGIVLALPVLLWGGFRFCLRMYDGGAAIGDLFAGFSRYGAALAGSLAWWLLSFVASIVGQIPYFAATAAESVVGMIVGYAFALLVSFLVNARVLPAMFLMVDRGLPFGEALSLSWERTGPLMWKLVALQLVSMLVVFAGALALLVGVIPASVVAYLMFASAYRQIFGREAAAAA